MSAQRRRQARRIARLLAPAAARFGGFASAEARVRARPGIVLRPDVCVGRGEPPYDGVLARAPVLVVVFGTAAEAAAWLTLGAEAVWSLAAGTARVHAASGSVSVAPPGGRLTVPGCPGFELRASDLLEPAVGPPDPKASALRPARVLR